MEDEVGNKYKREEGRAEIADKKKVDVKKTKN